MMFLGFLLLGAHVLMHLYASSVVTANAFDAVRIVSGSASGHDRAGAAAVAEQGARARMGSFGDRVAFHWDKLGPDEVELTVRADTPDLLPAQFAELVNMDVFERTIRLRVEKFR
ncbi:MAG: hypothetical protein ACRDYX_06495 [Egibacteraceae bacterium]